MMEPALTDVLERFYDYLDRNIEELEVKYPFLRCPAGCTLCCNTSIFLITRLEFEQLASWVREHFTPEQVAEFVAQAKAQVAASPLEASDIDERGAVITPGLVQVCPFVTETGCSVYEARPSLCRLFGRSAHMDGHRLNLCRVLTRQAEAAQTADLTSISMPTVERFTFILAAWLKQAIGKNPELAEKLDELLAINSICGFIADTELDPERMREARSLL